MAEFIENGDFATGDLPPWKEPSSVAGKIKVEKIGDQYYAVFAPDAKLVQSWHMNESHGRLVFSLYIKVADGSDLVSGNVQVVFYFQKGSGTPITQTYNIKESSTGEPLQLLMNVGADATSGTIELLVQPRFTNRVEITDISVAEAAQEASIKEHGFKKVK